MCGFLAVAKGLRLPSLWGATQAQSSCAFGIVKRCLYGQIWRWLGVPVNHYVVFAALSFWLLAAFLITLIWYARRMRLTASVEGAAVVALFASSFALTYLTSLVGYLDFPMAMLAIAAVASPPRWRLPAISAAALFGILLHELYFLVFLPVSLLSAILPALRDATSTRDALRRLAPSICVVLAAGALVVALAWGRPMDAASVAALKQQVTRSVDFPVDNFYFDEFFVAMCQSTLDNVRIMIGRASDPLYWVRQVLGALAFLPSVALAGWVAWKSAATAVPRAKLWLIAAVVTAAVLSPLLLNAFAWDLYRWQALVVLNAYVAMGVIAAQPHGLALATGDRRRFLFLAFLLMLANMATATEFMSSQPANMFPFDRLLAPSEPMANHAGP